MQIVNQVKGTVLPRNSINNAVIIFGTLGRCVMIVSFGAAFVKETNAVPLALLTLPAVIAISGHVSPLIVLDCHCNLD